MRLSPDRDESLFQFLESWARGRTRARAHPTGSQIPPHLPWDDHTVRVRERILAAATEEFASVGLAGARIGRIAESAHASKERIYAHFASKEEIFAAVLSRDLHDLVRDVPLVDGDLPRFAAALTHYAHEHPAGLRLIEWARLHGGDVGASYAREHEQHMADYRNEIAAAQHSGTIDTSWTPAELLTFSFALALAWSHDPALVAESTGQADGTRVPPDVVAARADQARRAMTRLVTPLTASS